jgi:hypothetical protein
MFHRVTVPAPINLYFLLIFFHPGRDTSHLENIIFNSQLLILPSLSSIGGADIEPGTAVGKSGVTPVN